MEKGNIFEGKTSTEAINKALKQLNIRKEEAEIEIIESEEKRSFFSILEPRIVKVRVTKKEVVEKQKKEISVETAKKSEEKIDSFLKEFFDKVNCGKIEYTISSDKYYVNVDVSGENTNPLIGYRGEVLNSLQTILNSIANNENEDKVRVLLNISGYREKRKKRLEDLAEKISKTVIKTGKKITLEPMTAYERKILHSKLQNNPKVTTESIGEEPNRRVIVCLKNRT